MPTTKPRPERRDALVKARQAAGLTQTQLAEKVGSHRVTIARIETGALDPTVPAALKLARALDTSVEALFGGDR